MARLNIEDSLVNDERFIFVSSKIGRYQAMGQFVFIAKLAQRYWIDGLLIPESIYNLGEFSDSFLLSGLVEKRENGVYLRGSEEHFAWILSKKENGQKGGRPRKTNDLAKANETEAKANESYENPLTLSPALSLTQIQNTKGDEKSPPRFGFNEIVKIWNNAAEQLGLAKVKPESKMLDALMKNNKKALLTYPDEESWQRIAEAIPLQNWRLGANDRGWKADFSWLFQNHGTKKIKNYILLMEEWDNYYGGNKND